MLGVRLKEWTRYPDLPVLELIVGIGTDEKRDHGHWNVIMFNFVLLIFVSAV